MASEEKMLLLNMKNVRKYHLGNGASPEGLCLSALLRPKVKNWLICLVGT
jgi:hypothetical protein